MKTNKHEKMRLGSSEWTFFFVYDDTEYIERYLFIYFIVICLRNNYMVLCKVKDGETLWALTGSYRGFTAHSCWD